MTSKTYRLPDGTEAKAEQSALESVLMRVEHPALGTIWMERASLAEIQQPPEPPNSSIAQVGADYWQREGHGWIALPPFPDQPKESWEFLANRAREEHMPDPLVYVLRPHVELPWHPSGTNASDFVDVEYGKVADRMGRDTVWWWPESARAKAFALLAAADEAERAS